MEQVIILLNALVVALRAVSMELANGLSVVVKMLEEAHNDLKGDVELRESLLAIAEHTVDDLNNNYRDLEDKYNKLIRDMMSKP